MDSEVGKAPGDSTLGGGIWLDKNSDRVKEGGVSLAGARMTSTGDAAEPPVLRVWPPCVENAR